LTPAGIESCYISREKTVSIHLGGSGPQSHRPLCLVCFGQTAEDDLAAVRPGKARKALDLTPPIREAPPKAFIDWQLACVLPIARRSLILTGIIRAIASSSMCFCHTLPFRPCQRGRSEPPVGDYIRRSTGGHPAGVNDNFEGDSSTVVRSTVRFCSRRSGIARVRIRYRRRQGSAGKLVSVLSAAAISIGQRFGNR
jgi:hypothetical protein